ncbi:MAG: SUMF1/EgtB/PvdO family nonheme iron enzyme, partial [Desulfobacteraceae bacterium]|nr:SUMF1/EgtB/PvdO family nonheme iron enzyme [Desulfobacteraceae bacterium]
MKKIVEIVLILGLGTSLCLAGNHSGVTSLIEKSRQGDTRAMCDLALDYYHGHGVLKDPFKAKCWVKKAHDLGSKRAGKIWEDLSLWQYSGKCDFSFDDEKRPQYQSGEQYREPVTGISFVWVGGGCFSMGCHGNAGRCGKDEKPSHRVCLDGFWMGAFEVTQGQWESIMGTNPSRFNLGPGYPVERVSFAQVRNFIQLLKTKTGQGFSLPTEAQWEYACRDRGHKKPYPWGRDSHRPHENCGTCSAGKFQGRTAVVGSFTPNDLGLYDMGGNVREWCRDVYDKKA